MKKHIILTLIATALFAAAAETNDANGRAPAPQAAGTAALPTNPAPIITIVTNPPIAHAEAFDPFTLPDAPPRDLPPSPFRLYTITNPPVQRVLRVVTEYEETVTTLEVQEVWKLEGTNRWVRFKDLPLGIPATLVSREMKTNVQTAPAR
jgi:hypothetical protein